MKTIANLQCLDIWRFPEMGIPQNHPCYFRMFHHKYPAIGAPHLWNPPYTIWIWLGHGQKSLYLHPHPIFTTGLIRALEWPARILGATGWHSLAVVLYAFLRGQTWLKRNRSKKVGMLNHVIWAPHIRQIFISCGRLRDEFAPRLADFAADQGQTDVEVQLSATSLSWYHFGLQICRFRMI